MRSFAVVLSLLLTGSINAEDGQPLEVPRDEGQDFTFTVTAIAQKISSCHLTTPAQESLDFYPDKPSPNDRYELLPIDSSSILQACSVTLRHLEESDNGVWQVAYKNGDGVGTSALFRITVTPHTENPSIEEDRIIRNITEQRVDSKLGESHRLVIQKASFINGESCHITTPAGVQLYTVEGFDLPGVEVIEESEVECGVVVNVLSEDMVGTWTLIARASEFGLAIERRSVFTISVEEIVDAVPSQVSIAEGSDLHIRLASQNDAYDTCHLERPSGGVAPFVLDPVQASTCGYIITGITSMDSGVWQITYGNKITYKALVSVQVVVSSDSTSFNTNVGLVRDRSVNKTVGPEDSIYCRLVDPQGISVFDGFGKCTLALDKVTPDHHGAWRMVVATSGKVIATEHQLIVNVTEAERPVVETRVETQKPIVTITCSVAAETVRTCKFRDPHGRILLAAGGLGEDRYIFHGAETSYKSGMKTHECGLQITDPQISDLGLWRCALETEEDIYYGFLDVLCPWALQVPAIAEQVQQVPILRSERSIVTGVEDEPITVSCSVEAAIRYCYFRARNGTTFSIFPGMSSSNMEYVGAGFEAGECGVRFRDMTHHDSGNWSCHVGLVRDSEEQRDQFQLVVQEALVVEQSRVAGGGVLVAGSVYAGRALEYCRYVRIDGLGFTSHSLPSGFNNIEDLSAGKCQFIALIPGMLELHPWTVAAKIRGQDREVSRQTSGSFDGQRPPGQTFRGPSVLTVILYIFLCSMLMAIILGACLGPKKNRTWTYNRASAIRRSIQRTVRRTPPQTTTDTSPPSYEAPALPTKDIV